jgi:hypothetical protein
MSKYWLSKHVYLCLSNDQVVLLDLRRNKYSTFNAADVSPLSRLVSGWPSVSPRAAAQPLYEDEEAFDDLIKTRILTTDRAAGKEAMPLIFDTADEDLLTPRDVFDDFNEPRHAVRGQCRAAFFAAVLAARAKRRCLSLERIVNGIRRRGDALQEFDWQELRLLLANFYWLRTWGYTQQDECLFDCLTLLYYLAWFGMHPRWVFGVRTAPLTVHCWLQAGTAVLNDHVNHTRLFTPIMAA